jgi:hypothetical protein
MHAAVQYKRDSRGLETADGGEGQLA